MYNGIIDLTDVGDKDNHFETRALAAISIMIKCGLDETQSASNITDQKKSTMKLLPLQMNIKPNMSRQVQILKNVVKNWKKLKKNYLNISRMMT